MSLLDVSWVYWMFHGFTGCSMGLLDVPWVYWMFPNLSKFPGDVTLACSFLLAATTSLSEVRRFGMF